MLSKNRFQRAETFINIQDYLEGLNEVEIQFGVK
jgi:hypothetical protein